MLWGFNGTGIKSMEATEGGARLTMIGSDYERHEKCVHSSGCVCGSEAVSSTRINVNMSTSNHKSAELEKSLACDLSNVLIRSALPLC